ncbi:hypothetical protein HPB49_001944 [Dermacentor silvarum]|uniref:Uncharacterized protein n=1 Tax=Dermacentor silvarum TaxID=543639 RepID=A0ACB8DA28_DERSI|nr:hypothetical protein HPB49_001944 [Dermacentor silvarum]
MPSVAPPTKGSFRHSRVPPSHPASPPHSRRIADLPPAAQEAWYSAPSQRYADIALLGSYDAFPDTGSKLTIVTKSAIKNHPLMPWTYWIAPSENTSQHVTWKYCSCKVRAHYTDLIKHSETHKHWNAFAPGNQLCLKDTIAHRLPADMEQKRCALKISLFTACHMGLNSVDEPSGILNGELRQDIALHRTNDIVKKVVSTFLDMKEISDGRAESIYETVNAVFCKNSVSPSDCVGL